MVSPQEKIRFIISSAPTAWLIAFSLAALSLSSCSMLTGNNSINREVSMGGGNILKGLRPAADPAMVERIREEEQKEAAKQAARAAMVTQTAGAAMALPGLGRNLPSVYTDPISGSIDRSAASAANTETNQMNNAFANQNTQLASYESMYSAVPPPPPGSLAGGLVQPPPPAISLNTQVAYSNGAADLYNNPYFNPYAIPAPPQSSTSEKRPAGLFGEGGIHNQSDNSSEKIVSKHKADFVPIVPSGMEPRSAYKQRDDIRILWKGILKEPSSLGQLADNKRLFADLSRIEISLPSESSRGNFNASARQVESLFKAAAVDRRIFNEIRPVQTELTQAYYRFLSTYNKYALAEQTTAARQQEVDLSDSDLERQRATADLSQAKNDLDSVKDDLRSAEIELAAASSPSAARAVIGRIAGVSPSIESLAQGSAQAHSQLAETGRVSHLANMFESVFRHKPDKHSKNNDESDTDENKTNKLSNAKNNDDEGNLISKIFGNKSNKENYDNAEAKTTADASDLQPAPKSQSSSLATEETNISKSSSESTNLSFELKGVNIKPRKAVLMVAVKNCSNEIFELNPDAIHISEGNHKLAAADMRTDFNITSIQPDQEVKGTITVFGRPWNDRLIVYMNDGNKTVSLKR